MTNTTPWRPMKLSHFIGQRGLLDALSDEIQIAKTEHKPLSHIVGHGPPGLGKTELFNLIASELEVPIYTVLGRDVTDERLTDLLFGVIGGGDNHPTCIPAGYDKDGFIVNPSAVKFPLFLIDEADDLPKSIYHALHSVLVPTKDGRIFFEAVRNRDRCRIWIPHVTVVMLTNHMGTLVKHGAACLSRFKYRYKFELYSIDEIIKIISQYAVNNHIRINARAAQMIAERSMGVPRRAIALFDRSFIRAKADGINEVTSPVVVEACRLIGVDDRGFDSPQRDYLKALVDAPGGRMGLDSLAARLGWDKEYVRVDVEPALIQRGLVDVVPGGRQITDAGRHIGGGTTKGLYSRAIHTT